MNKKEKTIILTKKAEEILKRFNEANLSIIIKLSTLIDYGIEFYERERDDYYSLDDVKTFFLFKKDNKYVGVVFVNEADSCKNEKLSDLTFYIKPEYRDNIDYIQDFDEIILPTIFLHKMIQPISFIDSRVKAQLAKIPSLHRLNEIKSNKITVKKKEIKQSINTVNSEFQRLKDLIGNFQSELNFIRPHIKQRYLYCFLDNIDRVDKFYIKEYLKNNSNYLLPNIIKLAKTYSKIKSILYVFFEKDNIQSFFSQIISKKFNINNLFFEKYKNLDQDTINKKFVEACKNNDIELVKFLLTSGYLPIHANIHYDFERGVNSALTKKHFELAKYLLTSNDLSEKVAYKVGLEFLCQIDNLELFIDFFMNRVESVSTDINDVFKLACNRNGLNVVKYLLTSKELHKNADIDFENSIALEYACFQKNTNLIDFLLTGENIRNLDINTNDDIAFQTACKWARLDTVKYLLESPKLNKHANLNANNDKGFIMACEGYIKKLSPKQEEEYFNLLKYLITEENIVQSDVIKDFLLNNKLMLIEELFNKRDLSNKLNTNLLRKDNTDKIIKI